MARSTGRCSTGKKLFKPPVGVRVRAAHKAASDETDSQSLGLPFVPCRILHSIHDQSRGVGIARAEVLQHDEVLLVAACW